MLLCKFLFAVYILIHVFFYYFISPFVLFFPFFFRSFHCRFDAHYGLALEPKNYQTTGYWWPVRDHAHSTFDVSKKDSATKYDIRNRVIFILILIHIRYSVFSHLVHTISRGDLATIDCLQRISIQIPARQYPGRIASFTIFDSTWKKELKKGFNPARLARVVSYRIGYILLIIPIDLGFQNRRGRIRIHDALSPSC